MIKAVTVLSLVVSCVFAQKYAPKPAYPEPAYPRPSYHEPKPRYEPAYPKPAYKPAYEPAYPKPAYEPAYPKPAYKPAYPKPAYPEPAYPKPAYEPAYQKSSYGQVPALPPFGAAAKHPKYGKGYGGEKYGGEEIYAYRYESTTRGPNSIDSAYAYKVDGQEVQVAKQDPHYSKEHSKY